MTKLSKMVAFLITAGPHTTTQIAELTNRASNVVGRELKRAARYGWVSYRKAGRVHLWAAMVETAPPDMRGRAAGSEDALAASHKNLELRKRRTRNLRNLKFDKAGNYIPKVRKSTCALADLWKPLFPSCKGD